MAYKIKKKLAYLMKDEQKAPKEYWKFYRLLKNEEQRKVIEGIIADEKRHYHQLKRIKKQENGI